MKRVPRSRGGTLLERYRKGERLTLGQSVAAKCAECCCNFADGLVSCGITGCPLFPFSPYQTKTSARTTDPKKHTATELSTTPNARRKRFTGKDETKEVTP
jgi:hypothetical protein